MAPTPSFCIVQFGEDDLQNASDGGYLVDHGTRLKIYDASDEKIYCEYKTTQEVALWPLASSGVTTGIYKDKLSRVNAQSTTGSELSELSIKFKTGIINNNEKNAPNKTTLYISDSAANVDYILELLSEKLVTVLIKEDKASEWIELSKDSIILEGFDNQQAILPVPKNIFTGYRLLREYFSFPQKFNFFSIVGLQKYLLKSLSEFSVKFVFNCELAENLVKLEKDNFKLFCTPCVNLIDNKSVRFSLDRNNYENHVITDLLNPLDYEVFSINKIEGYERDNTVDTVYTSLYQSSADSTNKSYFTYRREPRLISEKSYKRGYRSSYIGSEVFFTLVDKQSLPIAVNLKQVAVSMTVTNRDLPFIIRSARSNQIVSVHSLPVSEINLVVGLSEPKPALQDGKVLWSLVKHLGFNFNDLLRDAADERVSHLKELLDLYAVLGDRSIALNIQAIVGFDAEMKVMRLPGSGPLVFANGIEVKLTIDETQLQYGGAYLFGILIQRYLLRHVSINSFVAMRINTLQRGKIARPRQLQGYKSVI